MKDLILLMEPSKHEYITPLQIANLYLNRFTIDEDAAFEIIGVHELSKSRLELTDEESEVYDNLTTDEELDEYFTKAVENDFEVFDIAFNNALEKWTPGINFHVIYAGCNYITAYMNPNELIPIISDIMAGTKLMSLTFTMISMIRMNVITKEVMKDFYKGKIQDCFGFNGWSVQDDLDRFFDQTKNFQFIDPSTAFMFFLPKLTDDELILLRNKDENYLKLYADFHFDKNPDVNEAEMIKSKSKSKFAYCMCFRISGCLLNKPA